jgi:hypothetical protein
MQCGGRASSPTPERTRTANCKGKAVISAHLATRVIGFASRPICGTARGMRHHKRNLSMWKAILRDPCCGQGNRWRNGSVVDTNRDWYQARCATRSGIHMRRGVGYATRRAGCDTAWHGAGCDKAECERKTPPRQFNFI